MLVCVVEAHLIGLRRWHNRRGESKVTANIIQEVALHVDLVPEVVIRLESTSLLLDSREEDSSISHIIG